ncbi:MAG: CBS domain-containing protein [Desulfobacterales bacterium]|jgi:signal-transduction protein with cAMP-binding, CBS, and nucleotidyltransferase domain
MKTAEEIANDKNREIISVPYDHTIYQAARKMVENKIGVILVTKNDEIVGIWSEKDLLREIINPEFDPKTAKIGDYMTSPVKSAPHDTRIHKLEEMFLGLFVRHLLVEKAGKYIGLISIGDVTRASLIEKERNFKELNSFVGWRYYENWKWGRKK